MGSAKAKTLDFSGVEDRAGNFRPRRKPEGDYYAHVVEVKDHTSKEGNEGWVFTIKVDGDARSSYPYYVNFDKEQLWKARGLAVACGVKVPSGKVKMDPNKLTGKALGIALEDDEYEGRVKSTIAAIFPLEELSDARNEPGGKAASTKAKSRDADEDRRRGNLSLCPVYWVLITPWVVRIPLVSPGFSTCSPLRLPGIPTSRGPT